MDRKEARAKAHELVSKMTVAEAASQLKFDAPAIERLGVPEYNWWNETLHGVARAGIATVFPQAIGMAATFDKDLIHREAEICATEGRAKYNAAVAFGDRDIYKGLTFWSPNINIFRDPRWGRGHETLGEDPVLTSTLGAEFVKGLQGNGEHLKAAACAKHFAVHSGPEALRHEFDAVCSDKDLEETYLPAFETLVKEADVESVMGAYNRTLGEPCCGSKRLIVDKLRGEWGFEGHFVSDCWAVRDFHTRHKVTSRPEESVTLALSMGCDVNCGCTYEFVMNAYNEGLISEDLIRQSAERLFTTRYLLGIMDGSEYDDIPFDVVECDEHLAVSLEAAEKSVVLLKNNGILPLNKENLKTVGVIGPNADSRIALKGNYYGTASHNVTVLEGIQEELAGKARVLFSEGCHISRNRVENLARPDDRISEAKAVCRASDVVVLVVGLNENLEGEEGDEGNNYASGDKNDLLLPESQRNLIRAVAASGKPYVVVLMAGSSIDISEEAANADAILMGWYPGALGGTAIAKVLFGEVSPSGKLPVTMYHNSDLDKMPSFTDYAMDGRTYRYLDFDPLYPFGYGLTYGDVNVNSAEADDEGKEIAFTIEVENQGRDTEDVVQIYLENTDTPNATKHPKLVGFQRVGVKQGEKKTVTILVDKKWLQVVNEEGKHLMEGGYVFYVGLGQPNQQTLALTGKKSVMVAMN